jgi:hypothetical protein
VASSLTGSRRRHAGAVLAVLYASGMGWDIGVLRCELPPGASGVHQLVGELLPIAARAEVHAALAEILPGYEPDDSWLGRDFAVEIDIHPGDPVEFVHFTPRGQAPLAIEPVFAFAERFGALVFAFSDCQVLTRETARADWARFRAYRDRVYPPRR